MITLGSFVLYGAFLSAFLTMAAGVGAARSGNPALVRTTERSLLAMAGFVVAAVLVLQHALVTLDFTFEYVSEYTSSTLPFMYRVGSMWAGQGGSLLLWALVVSLGASWTLYRNRKASLDMSPYTWAVFGGIAAMFITMTTFVASPFTRAPEGTADGNGLNPLLQDPLQIIHPLALYGGYVLYTIPFAVVMGQLIAGKIEGPWVTYARTWNILSWLMLTIGIVLGARWAYAELGWGGYWAWDPVENASLIPWLAGTAVLHTGLNYGGTRALRTSSVAILAGAFNLCLFGTYLTRSGVIQSVHAFGASSLGSYLGISVALIALASATIIVWRMPQMKREDPFARGHGWLSKLILTGLLLAMTVAVLWGTIFPLFARAFAGKEIAVTPGFFRVVVAPMGVLILVQFALSPFLPGQEVAERSREIKLRSGIFGVVLLGMLGLSRLHHPGVALVTAFAVLAVVTVVQKAIPKVSEGLRNEKTPILSAAKESSPYIGHIGVIIMLAAITLNVAYQTHGQEKLKLNSTATIASQKIRLDGVQANQYPDRMSFTATVSVLNGSGAQGPVIVSKLEQFNNAEQLQAQVGIHVTLMRDIYVVVDEVDATPGAEYAVLTVYDNPGVLWLWIGGFLLALGGILYATSSMMRAREQTGSTVKLVKEVSSSDDGLAALLAAAIAATESGKAHDVDDSVRKLIDTARKITGDDASDRDVVEFLKLAQSKAGKSGTTRSPQQLAVIGISAAVVVGILAYLLGNMRASSLPGIDSSQVVTTSSASATAAAVDKAKVGELMAKLAADPKDSTVLWDLGNTYFTGGDFVGALKFYQMLVKVTPKDDAAWIAVGAAAFNTADDKTAKSAWEKASKLNPKNAEAHYNLGFWYLAQNPADEASAKKEWQKVIDIDPKSDMATNVKQHLDSLATKSPTPAS